jgi:hypothetical protein
MKKSVVKDYGMVVGLRCAYRYHRATDATRFLHGHSLGFSITLSAEVDDKEKYCDKGILESFIAHSSGWMDEYLEEAFNHAVIVSTEDPYANVIAIMETEGLADLRWMVGVGLPEFAQMIKTDFNEVLQQQTNGVIRVDLVIVTEHQANGQGVA